MSVGSAAHVEQARSPFETTQASWKRKKSRPARIWGCVIAAAALSGCTEASLDSAADSRSDEADSALAVGRLGNPGVVPPDGLVDNMSLAQWSAIWWQQILAIPYKRNPVFDGLEPDVHHGFEHCSEGAHGDVWFLAGTAGGKATRTCTIPTGTRILFPLLATADDNNHCDPPLDCSDSPTLEACLTANAPTLLPDPTLFAKVDGRRLHHLLDYVQTSKLFFFTGDKSLIATWDPCIIDHGKPQEAVSYGWWIMLEPLRPGTHTLHFGGTSGTFSVDVTYTLHIVH
jgi:hypothetical protein